MEIIKTESSEFLICWNEKNAKRRYNALFNSIKALISSHSRFCETIR
jgi:hypothetical protein